MVSFIFIMFFNRSIVWSILYFCFLNGNMFGCRIGMIIIRLGFKWFDRVWVGGEVFIYRRFMIVFVWVGWGIWIVIIIRFVECICGRVNSVVYIGWVVGEFVV